MKLLLLLSLMMVALADAEQLPVPPITITNLQKNAAKIVMKGYVKRGKITGWTLKIQNLDDTSDIRSYTLPANSDSVDLTPLDSGTGYRVTLTALAKAGDTNAVQTKDFQTLPDKEVLLLHGMNTGPETWDALIEHLRAKSTMTVPVIYGGALYTRGKPASGGFYVYSLRFGSFDGSEGRIGLEDVKAAASMSGDFTSFAGLGKEVEKAVQEIRKKHRRSKIVLVAHSRGGLAARAYLQNPVADRRDAVHTLITTGTPHAGSKIGRIYQWLSDNGDRQGKEEDTWEVARDLILLKSWGLDGLDVRRPTIQDLADNSTAFLNLNSRVSISNAPSSIVYINMRYKNMNFGDLLSFWNIFDRYGPQGGPQVTNAFKKECLGEDSVGMHKGDGIVELEAQSFPAAFGALDVVQTTGNNVLHTEEPSRKADLERQIKNAINAIK